MHKLGRVIRGLASGLALVVLIGGGAWTLWNWGRLDALLDVRWGQIWRIPDDGSLVLGLLTAVGWVAWVWVTGTVVCEGVAAVSRGRWRPGLPGSSWLRPAMAVLVMSVLGLAVAAHGLTGGSRAAGSGHAAQTGRTGGGIAGAGQSANVQDEAAAVASGEAAVRPYVVRPGDDLWSLAERFAGGGDHWRDLAAANQTVVLDPGVDLVPGTMLMVPVNGAGVSTTSVQETTVPVSSIGLTVLVTPRPADVGPGGQASDAAQTVEVQPGDTLWQLAGTYLGDPLRWPELYQANSGDITDPALIHPGQVLVIPGTQAQTAPEPVTEKRMSEATSVGRPDAEEGPAPVDLPPMAGTIYETSRPEAEKPGASAGADGPSHGPEAALDSPESLIKALLGSIGAGLAASMVVGLAGHRLTQLRNRPVGRALPRVPADVQRFETAMDRRASELLRRLDDDVDARPDEPVKLVDAVSAARSGDAADDAPSLDGSVVLGVDSEGRDVPLDLVAAGVVQLVGDEDQTVGLMAALAGQLLAIDSERRPDVVMAAPSLAWLATLLDCPLTPADQASLRLRSHAFDGDQLEPLVVFADVLPVEDWASLRGVTVVTAGAAALPGATKVIEFVAEDEVRIAPDGPVVTAQLVLPPARRSLSQLVDVVTSADYPGAPWWSAATESAQSPATLADVVAMPSAAPVSGATDDIATRRAAPVVPPQLNVLGPVELVNARGVVPDRAARQCLEFCGWLLRYPGQTSVTMVRSLLVAEGTRRSNVSRLRLWLGSNEAGEPYLPDAHSGRVRLHPGVTSDWERMQTLIAGGVNQASDERLTEALKLVRGAPLADAAPGQWHWAEEWRCDMVATIRDVGVVLAGRALARQDLDLARWAAARALLAAPEDDRLMAVRIRTEYLAGNHAEVERLALHVTRMARMVGFDLPDYMVDLLQEVIEGAPRLREAA